MRPALVTLDQVQVVEASDNGHELVSSSAHPVLAYLGGPTSERSRVTQLGSLRAALAAITGQPTREIDPGHSRVPGPEILAIPWAELTPAHSRAIRARLQEAGHSPAYCNKIMAAVRGVLKAAWLVGLMDGDCYARSAQGLGTIRAERLPTGRNLSDAEIAALMRVCSDDP